MHQEPLFDAPEVTPITKPKNIQPGLGKVIYKAFSSPVRTLCTDCCSIVHDELAAGRVGPAIRRARKVRTQGKEQVWLCDAHADMRKQIEAAAEKAS